MAHSKALDDTAIIGIKSLEITDIIPFWKLGFKSIAHPVCLNLVFAQIHIEDGFIAGTQPLYHFQTAELFLRFFGDVSGEHSSSEYPPGSIERHDTIAAKNSALYYSFVSTPIYFSHFPVTTLATKQTPRTSQSAVMATYTPKIPRFIPLARI